MAKIAGIDEAGRGPVIGPMVMCGVLIEEEKEELLKKLGVKDSKLLSPNQREAMFEKILAVVDDYSIEIVSPEQIDAALNDPDYNLNWLEADSIAKIINKLNPEKAIADCPSTNTKAFSAYVAKKIVNKKTRLVLEHKADEKYPVVSAASIIAKVTRDREIVKLHKIYGNFGSGYPSDPRTKEFLKKNYNLPIYRRSWETWKKAAEKKKQSSLSDF